MGSVLTFDIERVGSFSSKNVGDAAPDDFVSIVWDRPHLNPQMIDRVLKFGAQRPRHFFHIGDRSANVKYLDLTRAPRS